MVYMTRPVHMQLGACHKACVDLHACLQIHAALQVPINVPSVLNAVWVDGNLVAAE